MSREPAAAFKGREKRVYVDRKGKARKRLMEGERRRRHGEREIANAAASSRAYLILRSHPALFLFLGTVLVCGCAAMPPPPPALSSPPTTQAQAHAYGPAPGVGKAASS